MCPECGGTRTRVVNSSHDPEGQRIRARDCKSCGTRFGTVEVPFPFSFHEADADKREAPAYSSRIKVPEYEPSRFEIRRGRVSARAVVTADRKHERVHTFTPDPEGPIVVVSLKRSAKYPRCRKGLHVMRGANVYQHPRGHKVCNACRRAASNALYRYTMDRMPESIRAERNAESRARKRAAMADPEKRAAKNARLRARYAADAELRERKRERDAAYRAAHRDERPVNPAYRNRYGDDEEARQAARRRTNREYARRYRAAQRELRQEQAA